METFFQNFSNTSHSFINIVTSGAYYKVTKNKRPKMRKVSKNKLIGASLFVVAILLIQITIGDGIESLSNNLAFKNEYANINTSLQTSKILTTPYPKLVVLSVNNEPRVNEDDNTKSVITQGAKPCIVDFLNKITSNPLGILSDGFQFHKNLFTEKLNALSSLIVPQGGLRAITLRPIVTLLKPFRHLSRRTKLCIDKLAGQFDSILNVSNKEILAHHNLLDPLTLFLKQLIAIGELFHRTIDQGIASLEKLVKAEITIE